MLSHLCHPNLVNFIGYSAEGNQCILVYEFMPLGSLEYHLHGLKPHMVLLDWNSRMKIAAGVAKCLDYLHNQVDPPVLYKDLKSSDIVLDEVFHPKLSNSGLLRFVPDGEKYVSTRVINVLGYGDVEYSLLGRLTKMDDVYSFGVLLLEQITGQRALNKTLEGGHRLVGWADPMLRYPQKYLQLADPNFEGQFSEPVLWRAVEVACTCVCFSISARPDVRDVVLALND